VRGATNGTREDYTLEGGTLEVKDILVSDGALFQHTGGNVTHSGVLILDAGNWHAATGDYALGPLQLGAGQSSISFPDGSSVLRLANSSAEPWNSGILYITNWHGSVSGEGATQLFGLNSNGLTAEQLAQIRFDISGSLQPAKILATGEVVPESATQPNLQFSRNGNSFTLQWPSGSFLQSSTNVAGPYQDVPGATSPYPVNMTKPAEYFRLRQ